MKNKNLRPLSRRIQWMGLAALVAAGSACDSGAPGELPELDGSEDLEDLQEIEGIVVHEWIEPQTEVDPWFDPDAEIGEFSAGIVLGRTVVEGGEGPMVVTYENVHGHAIVEGDIDLGPVESLPEIGEEELDELSLAIAGGGDIDPQYAFAAPPIWGQPWSNGVVYYVPPAFGSSAINNAINNAINQIEAQTNIDFFPIPESLSGYFDHIFFSASIYQGVGSASSNSVGRKGGRQYITLSLVDVLGGVVANNGLYVHELGHALGLHHEHTRQDRDTYVTVNWFCIQSGQSHNFEKKLGIPLGAYDPTSVMHYRTNTFLAGSFFCRSTLIPKPGVTIAPSNGLSSGDISALNWLASL